ALVPGAGAAFLPTIPEDQWRENLALVAAWLAEFGGRPLAEPPRIDWKAPSALGAEQGEDFQDGVEPGQHPANDGAGNAKAGTNDSAEPDDRPQPRTAS